MRAVGLPYAGGKSSAQGSRSVGSWIVSMLPDVPSGEFYVEPYAGMLGVLLARRRTGTEVVNDLDERIINWWRMLRDRTDELLHLVAHTPPSRAEFKSALAALDDPDDLRRAWALAVVLGQGITSSTQTGPWGWSAASPSHRARQRTDGLRAAAARMSGVVLECRPAVEVAAQFACRAGSLLYIDPPYRTATHGRTSYGGGDGSDWPEMTDVLAHAAARVAISGYAGEWDHLGWRRLERDGYSGIGTTNARRTEVLWMNYAHTSPPQLPIDTNWEPA